MIRQGQFLGQQDGGGMLVKQAIYSEKSNMEEKVGFNNSVSKESDDKVEKLEQDSKSPHVITSVTTRDKEGASDSMGNLSQIRSSIGFDVRGCGVVDDENRDYPEDINMSNFTSDMTDEHLELENINEANLDSHDAVNHANVKGMKTRGNRYVFN